MMHDSSSGDDDSSSSDDDSSSVESANTQLLKSQLDPEASAVRKVKSQKGKYYSSLFDFANNTNKPILNKKFVDKKKDGLGKIYVYHAKTKHIHIVFHKKNTHGKSVLNKVHMS
ncbi:hypothetical protein YC2023_009714 [Brassica napus]